MYADLGTRATRYDARALRGRDEADLNPLDDDPKFEIEGSYHLQTQLGLSLSCERTHPRESQQLSSLAPSPARRVEQASSVLSERFAPSRPIMKATRLP